MLGNRGAITVADIRIEKNDIVVGTAAPEEDPAVRNFDLVIFRLADIEEVLRDAHNCWINFNRAEGNIGIIILKSSLRAAAAKTDHQDVCYLGIPKPGHVEEVDVFEMTFE